MSNYRKIKTPFSRKNPFAGADDFKVNKKSFKVTKVYTENGILKERVRYLPKNEKNTIMAIDTYGIGEVYRKR